jgi:hypothetical protein
MGGGVAHQPNQSQPTFNRSPKGKSKGKLNKKSNLETSSQLGNTPQCYSLIYNIRYSNFIDFYYFKSNLYLYSYTLIRYYYSQLGSQTYFEYKTNVGNLKTTADQGKLIVVPVGNLTSKPTS